MLSAIIDIQRVLACHNFIPSSRFSCNANKYACPNCLHFFTSKFTKTLTLFHNNHRGWHSILNVSVALCANAHLSTQYLQGHKHTCKPVYEASRILSIETACCIIMFEYRSCKLKYGTQLPQPGNISMRLHKTTVDHAGL